MSKKIVFPIVVAFVLTLIAGLVVSSSASAQSKNPLPRLIRARPTLGQVTSIGNGQFTIETRNGEQRTFQVDDRTRYRSKEKTELTFSDLETGGWVAVVTGRFLNARDLARLVVLLPADFDPEQLDGARGKVSAVNLAASEFTIEDQQGQKTVVTTDEETIFRGQVTSLADLKAGMAVGVIAKETTGDGLVARTVRAGDPIGVHLGEVTGVKAAGGSFTLKPVSASQSMVVSVDEQTRFRSKNNQIAELKDLETGMFAMVVTKTPVGDERTDDSPVAVLVAAVDKADLPQVDLWVGGRVVSTGKNSLTIENRDGKEFTFQTTGDTRFRSREVRSLADLQTGMLALVGAKELGNGSYQAQIVLVIPRR